MTRYFMITGLENGNPIEPYAVETNGALPYAVMNQYGDIAIYAEEISKKQYNNFIRFNDEMEGLK